MNLLFRNLRLSVATAAILTVMVMAVTSIGLTPSQPAEHVVDGETILVVADTETNPFVDVLGAETAQASRWGLYYNMIRQCGRASIYSGDDKAQRIHPGYYKDGRFWARYRVYLNEGGKKTITTWGCRL